MTKTELLKGEASTMSTTPKSPPPGNPFEEFRRERDAIGDMSILLPDLARYGLLADIADIAKQRLNDARRGNNVGIDAK